MRLGERVAAPRVHEKSLLANGASDVTWIKLRAHFDVAGAAGAALSAGAAALLDVVLDAGGGLSAGLVLSPHPRTKRKASAKSFFMETSFEARDVSTAESFAR